MEIQYYFSTLNPDCYFVALDRVIVAKFVQGRWIDKGVYRPVRSFYSKTEWTGVPYDPDLLVDIEEFKYVKQHGHEMVRP